MKKIIGIILVSLMFCNIGYAEIRLIEEKTVKGKEFRYTIATVCVDGNKFVVGRRLKVQSMAQFFERKITADGKLISVPSYC